MRDFLLAVKCVLRLNQARKDFGAVIDFLIKIEWWWYEPLSLWKNIIIVLALVLGLLYTIPTFFGTTPGGFQVSGAKATVKVEADVKDKVEQVLKAQNIPYTGFVF